MNWRPATTALHRDLGFFAVGLTMVYAVSGIAVNHRGDWNYNQSVEEEVVRIGTPAELLHELPVMRREELAGDWTRLSAADEPALVRAVGVALGRTAAPKNAFWRGPDRLSLFYETGDRDTVDYRPASGEAVHKVMRDRPILRSLNFLHRNEGQGLWTWIADGYAAVLLFLAISGAIMVRGRKGLVGRGGIFAALGILVPAAAWLMRAW